MWELKILYDIVKRRRNYRNPVVGSRYIQCIYCMAFLTCSREMMQYSLVFNQYYDYNKIRLFPPHNTHFISSCDDYLSLIWVVWKLNRRIVLHIITSSTRNGIDK